jgi:hypothetical protein
MATVIVLVHLNGKPLEDWAFKGGEGGGSSPPPSLAGMVVGSIEDWERKDASPRPRWKGETKGYTHLMLAFY